jgi:hypothetical protein
MYLIVINIQKTKESQLSILLRILANYLQLISVTLSFNLNYPDGLTNLLFPIERVGSPSDSFLSFDCFIKDYEIKGFTPSNTIFKIFLTGLLPILLIFLTSIIWMGLSFTKWAVDLEGSHIFLCSSNFW